LFPFGLFLQHQAPLEAAAVKMLLSDVEDQLFLLHG
jgi:hypothetical protein